MKACRMPRREGPRDRERVRVSKREPSIEHIPERVGIGTTHRLAAGTPAPLYARPKAMPRGQPAPTLSLYRFTAPAPATPIATPARSALGPFASTTPRAAAARAVNNDSA